MNWAQACVYRFKAVPVGCVRVKIPNQKSDSVWYFSFFLSFLTVESSFRGSHRSKKHRKTKVLRSKERLVIGWNEGMPLRLSDQKVSVGGHFGKYKSWELGTWRGCFDDYINSGAVLVGRRIPNLFMGCSLPESVSLPCRSHRQGHKSIFPDMVVVLVIWDAPSYWFKRTSQIHI